MTARVVITGMGWVTPLGEDLEATWNALLSGRSAVGPVTRFDASSLATNFAAEVKGFDLAAAIPDPRRRAPHENAGIHTRFALAAAARAWNHSGLDANPPDPTRVGIYMGCGEGPPDLDPFARANIAAWRPEQRASDIPTWARVALQRMATDVEIGQEPHIPLAHLASLLGCRGLQLMRLQCRRTQAVGEAFRSSAATPTLLPAAPTP